MPRVGQMGSSKLLPIAQNSSQEMRIWEAWWKTIKKSCWVTCLQWEFKDTRTRCHWWRADWSKCMSMITPSSMWDMWKSKTSFDLEMILKVKRHIGNISASRLIPTETKMTWQSPSPGHPSTVDEAWYWPTCILCSGNPYIASRHDMYWLADCSCSHEYQLTAMD